MNCDRIVELLDSPENPDVALHLETCEACSRILANRMVLRDRLRAAARNAEVPPDLQARIQHRIVQPARPAASLSWALAAALLLSIGLVHFYQTANPGIAPGFSPIMEVGLAQHIHCAVSRSYPPNRRPSRK